MTSILHNALEHLIKQNAYIFTSKLGQKGVTDTNEVREKNKLTSLNQLNEYANYNIKTGHGGVVDIDLDWGVTANIASQFLSNSNFIYGRESKEGNAHMLYKATDLEKKHTRKYFRFRDSTKANFKDTIIELRAHNHYTMIGGKYDEGESVQYNKVGNLTETTYQQLLQQTATVACCSVIIHLSKRCRPHNEYYKFWASILAQYKIDEATAEKIFITAIKNSDCEDCKTKDYKNRLLQIKKNYKLVAEKQQIQGFPSFITQYKLSKDEADDIKDILYAMTGREELPSFTHDIVHKITYMMKQKKFYDLDEKEMFDQEAIDMKYAKHFPKYTPIKFWKMHPDSMICNDFIYKPSEPKRYVHSGKSAYVNTYEKNNIAPDDTAEDKIFYDLVKHVIPHDDHRKHFLDYIAFVIQNPGRKIRHAIVLQSDEEQLGKGSLFDIVRDILGKSNTRKIELGEALDKAKGYLVNSQFVLIDEAKSKGNWQENSMLVNTLKTIITEGSASTRAMYKDYAEADTCTCYWINTNHKDAFAIPKKSARYWVYFSPAQRNQQLLDEYHKQRLEGNLVQGVYASLLKRDVSKFNYAGTAPWTEYAQQMSMQADRPLNDYVREMFEQGVHPMDKDIISSVEYFDYLRLVAKVRVTREREVANALINIGGIVRRNIKIPMVGDYCTVYIIRNHEKYKNVSPDDLSLAYKSFCTDSQK